MQVLTGESFVVETDPQKSILCLLFPVFLFFSLFTTSDIFILFTPENAHLNLLDVAVAVESFPSILPTCGH